jgi:hypothetical protein
MQWSRLTKSPQTIRIACVREPLSPIAFSGTKSIVNFYSQQRVGIAGIGIPKTATHTKIETMKASMKLVSKFIGGLVLVSVCFAISGCDSEPEIRVYEVAKKQSTTQAAPARILAAIVPHKESVYYVKATEAPSRFTTTFDELKSVVEKLTFSANDEPQWTLPEGWEQLPGSGISIATLQLSKISPPIRFAVTVLGGPESNWDNYLEENVNRWRGQVGLENVSLKEQRQSMTEIKREGEPIPAYIVDITGSRSTDAPSGMSAPFLESMGMAPPSDANNPSPSPPSENSPLGNAGGSAVPGAASVGTTSANAEPTPSPLKYQAPSNWTFRGAGSFRLATFEIEKDGEKGEVTVSSARNNLAENAAMWQTQVDPEATEEIRQASIAQSLSEVESVKFEKGDGQLILFRKGTDDDSAAILIAVIPTESPEESLFVKLKGNLKLAKSERQSLIDFATSIRW